MKITELLTEINIDVLRLIAVNTDAIVGKKDDGMDFALKKFRSMFDAIKNKSVELNNTLGFFDKMEFKRDLHKLKSIMQNNRTDDRWKVFESSNMLSKICAKYKVDYEYETPKKSVDRASSNREDDYIPGLEERIRQAYVAARENRAKNGVRADNPVTTIDIDEINKRAREMAEEQEQLERVARISAAIEKKKAEQRKRLIDSEESVRYESVMARKIKAMLREFDEDEDEQLQDGEMVSIRYEYQNDTYYMDGEPVLKRPKRLLTIREKEEYIKSKLRNPSEFEFLFNTFIQDEKKTLKNCDPYIIGILLSKDVRLAKDYVKQMTGIPRKKTSPQAFKIIYDVRGLETGRGGYLSSKEKRSIRATANLQRNVAKVLEDRRRLPWYAAIPFVGALAVAGIAGVTAANNENIDSRDVSAGNSYTDTLKTTTEAKTTHTTAVTTYTSPAETTVTSITTSTSTTPSVSKATDENNKEEKENNGVEEKKEKEQKVVINIGDKISVQDGLKYTADCLGGGNSNRIGAVSWRPAAEYNVERIAFTYQGRILKIMNRGDFDVENTLYEVAALNGIKAADINTSVLLSLVPGTSDTGWANISLENMKHNISKPIQEQSSVVSYDSIDLDR